MANETLKFNVKVDATDASRNLRKFKKQAIDSGTKISGVWKKVAIAGAFTAAAAGAAAFAKATKAIVTTYSSFEKELANVSTLVDTNTVSMKKLKDEILALPSIMGSATENTKALYQAISAGVKPSEAVKLIEESAKAAGAGLTSTFTAVEGGTTILNAYGLSALGITEIFDQMFTAVKAGKTTFEELSSSIGKVAPVASAVGVSTKELFTAIATLTKQGISTSESITALKGAFSNIIKPSSEAAKIAEKMGIAFSVSELKSKGFAGFLAEIREKTGGNVEAMSKLFGSVEALNAILALTSDAGFADFNKILGEMEQSSGATEEAFGKQVKTFAAQSTALKASLEKIGIIIGEKIVPQLSTVLVDFTAWLDRNKEFIAAGFVEVWETFALTFSNVQKTLTLMAPAFKLLLTVFSLLNDALQIALKGWGKILDIFIRMQTAIGKLVEGTKAVIGSTKQLIGLGEEDPGKKQARVNKLAKEAVISRKLQVAELQKALALLDRFEKVEADVRRERVKTKTWAETFSPTKEQVRQMDADNAKIIKDTERELTKLGINMKIGLDLGGASVDFDTIRDKLEDLRDAAAEGVTIDFKGKGSSELPLSEKIAEIGQMFGELFTGIAEERDVVFSFETAAGEALSTAFDSMESNFQTMIGNFIDGTTSVKDAFKNMAIDVLKTISKMAANRAISELFSVVAGGLGGALGGGGPYIPALANGGIAKGGQPHIVGERGPELFIPGKTGAVVPTSGMGGTSLTIVNNVNVTSEGRGGGSQADQRNLGQNIARMVSEQTRATIMTETRPGGMLNRGGRR